MKIALIGCSGSIGFCFSALIGGRDKAALSALCKEFRPAFAGLAEGGEVSLPEGTRLLRGEDILEHAFDGADVALIAAGGFAGLSYTLRAARLGIRIALANKESLVCGGELVLNAVNKSGSDLVPVDSEHSALFQALSFRRDTPFEKLILTASGGPFFKLGEEELKTVKAIDALRHPTWKMGPKITIDSATLLNKGYEVIEAKWLYGAPFERIEAVVHPESIVHSLVSFQDGAMMAQLGYPDMKLPIQLALTYPERLPCVRELDLVSLGALHCGGEGGRHRAHRAQRGGGSRRPCLLAGCDRIPAHRRYDRGGALGVCARGRHVLRAARRCGRLRKKLCP